ncbi:GGDEF domain-containing protein [Jannaschia rubra]|uniref:Putative diguanylate cyclase YegE n=1 Tax=Jannaschia rubra TaxID=282197 RepID=A0A0M6XNT8_9RHOB|nr:GGDEF domain-containing protein [Jannaschia rubra]CTQ32836.1 putative diguanylate cyclase YegE [Jannaschia rubra]SFG81530.1 diguanylate cyclase (GGDEF) domain-containing protein [Jannaschia rubra]
MNTVTLHQDVLDGMIPMSMVVDRAGLVVHVGPTVGKIAAGVVGATVDRAVRFTHPTLPATYDAMIGHSGRKLRAELLTERKVGPGEERTSLRAMVIPLVSGQAMISFSLGANPAPALSRHSLTAKDFFETDPIVDVLYLIEAHKLVLSEYRNLSGRLEEARVLAEEDAVTDMLTGLRNRRAMDEHLSRLVGRKGARFGLMHLDLDYFKTVNDTLGHAAGDRVLAEVARILREEVRQGDLVARVGGDEFMLAFDNCADVDMLRGIAGRIISRLEIPIDWDGHVCRISGSIGLTMSGFYDEMDTERLILDADKALYEAKRTGRGRLAVFTPVQSGTTAGGNC